MCSGNNILNVHYKESFNQQSGPRMMPWEYTVSVYKIPYFKYKKYAATAVPHFRKTFFYTPVPGSSSYFHKIGLKCQVSGMTKQE